MKKCILVRFLATSGDGFKVGKRRSSGKLLAEAVNYVGDYQFPPAALTLEQHDYIFA